MCRDERERFVPDVLIHDTTHKLHGHFTMASVFSGAKEKSARSSKSEDQDWVKTITDDLKQIAAQTRPHPENVMYRVRRQLRDLKPEHVLRCGGVFLHPLRQNDLQREL